MITRWRKGRAPCLLENLYSLELTKWLLGEGGASTLQENPYSLESIPQVASYVEYTISDSKDTVQVGKFF